MTVEHPQPVPQYMTPRQVAGLLGVDTSTLRRWAKDPDPETRRLNAEYTPGGHARYLTSEVHALLRGKVAQIEENEEEN